MQQPRLTSLNRIALRIPNTPDIRVFIAAGRGEFHVLDPASQRHRNQIFVVRDGPEKVEFVCAFLFCASLVGQAQLLVLLFKIRGGSEQQGQKRRRG